MANPIITILAIAGVVGSTGGAVAINTGVLDASTGSQIADASQALAPVYVIVPAAEPEPVIVTRSVPNGDASPSSDISTSTSGTSGNGSSTSTTNNNPPSTETGTGASGSKGGSGSGEYEEDDEDEDSEYEDSEQEDGDDD